jgi:hypothetical protein
MAVADWLTLVSPDATVWAVPGVEVASSLAGRTLRQRRADAWNAALQGCRRTDGAPPCVHLLPASGAVTPSELCGDVTFVVVDSRPAAFREATIHIASRYACCACKIECLLCANCWTDL